MNDAHDLARRLEVVAKDLTGPQMEKVLTDIGVESKPLFAKAVSTDLGGSGFSRWKATLDVRFDHDGPNEIVFEPARRSIGPWKVAQFGRRAGGSHDMVLTGRKRKDGTRRGGSRGRNQGATRPFHTWDDASTLVEKDAPKKALDAIHRLIVRGLR